MTETATPLMSNSQTSQVYSVWFGGSNLHAVFGKSMRSIEGQGNAFEVVPLGQTGHPWRTKQEEVKRVSHSLHSGCKETM